MDREERLRQAYEIVIPEKVSNVNVKHEEEAVHEEKEYSPVCEGIQQSANS